MEKWIDNETIARWILTFLVVFILLITLFVWLIRKGMERILNARRRELELQANYQRELLESSLKVQEREQERIAAIIHDELIGKLVRVQLMVSLSDSIHPAISVLGASIEQARTISHELSPPMLMDKTLNELVSEVCDPFCTVFRLQYYHIRQVVVGELSGEIRIQLIRILQEWMNNIRKHAVCSSVRIYIRQSNQYVLLLISDDGKGFVVQETNPGLGLKSIEARAGSIHAVWKIQSVPGKGTRLYLKIPYSK